jgi:trans-aconitate methyltransferase
VTVVQAVLEHPITAAVMARVPMPLRLARPVLTRDNAKENRQDAWQRLRTETEAVRYRAVRGVVEAYGADGFVLDVGCSQGILQEGLRYARYLGVDSFPGAIERARVKEDDRTRFELAEATTYRPDLPPDVVVLNEVVYYLPDPLGTIVHYARQLAPGGVVVVSVYSRAWACRRLLRRLARELEEVHRVEVSSGHLAWSVGAYRPR